MALNIIQGYSPSTTEPIDSRFVTATSSSRFAIPVFNAYEGLLVYQTDNNKVYSLIDIANINNSSGWQEIGAGGGATNPTNQVIPKNDNGTFADSQISDNGTTVTVANKLSINNNSAPSGSYLGIASNYIEYDYASLEIDPSTSRQFLSMPYLSHGIINISYNIYVKNSEGSYNAYGRAGNIQVFSSAYLPSAATQVPFNEQTIEVYSEYTENTEDMYFDFVYNNGNIQGFLYNDSPTSYAFLSTEYKLL